MSTVYELVCIACPVGCQIRAEVRQDKIVNIEGNSCKRGESYAQEEIFRPLRVVTSTIRVQGAALPVVPVRTAKPIPKEKIKGALQELALTVVSAPIKFHQAIIEDIAGTGISVIATRSLGLKATNEQTA